jgi:hypothetical protein
MKPYGNILRVVGLAAPAALLLLLVVGPTAPNRPLPFTPAAGGNEGPKRAKPPNNPANNEDKWSEVAAFMQKTSPKKWAAYNKLPETAKASLRAQLIAQYNELGKLANNNKLHTIEVERVQIEDDIFGALSERKRTHAQGEYSPEYLRAVKKLVENRMQERKARLENLTTVVKQDEFVKNNPTLMDDFVLQRAKAIERNGVAAGAQGIGQSLPGQPATSESSEAFPGKSSK